MLGFDGVPGLRVRRVVDVVFFVVFVVIAVFFWQVAERDGGSRDSNGGRAYAKGSPVSALPALSIDDFKVRGKSASARGADGELRHCN